MDTALRASSTACNEFLRPTDLYAASMVGRGATERGMPTWQ